MYHLHMEHLKLKYVIKFIHVITKNIPHRHLNHHYPRLKSLRRFPLCWLQLLILGLHPREALSL
jgi:hypothetical protein